MAEPGSLLLPLDVHERALSRLERWTAESSASGEPDGLTRMAERLIAEAVRLGLPARILREPDDEGRELPVVEIRSRHLSPRPLLLLGHFDTVLPAIAPRRDGERLVATGAIDMKGGLVAYFGALELLAARGGGAIDRLDFLLLLSPDEEVGGAISRRLVERHGVAARALWVLEPGEPSPGPPAGGETIVAGRRGLFQWRLRARGRAAHSGVHFWHGRSAIAAAAEWSSAAAALSRPQDGPTVNVSRFVGGARDFVEQLAAGADRLGSARELNVVPDRAVVEGEARFLRAEEEPGLHQALVDAADRIGRQHGVDLEYRRFARIAPVDPRLAGRDWADRAVSAAAAAGWRLEVEESRGGVSFPNFLTTPGAIPVLDGLGPVGGGMHTRDEFVELASLYRRIALLADLLELDIEERDRTDAPAG